MDFLKLTKDKLVVSDLSDLVAHEACGAISLFVGTTRDNFEDKKVIYYRRFSLSTGVNWG